MADVTSASPPPGATGLDTNIQVPLDSYPISAIDDKVALSNEAAFRENNRTVFDDKDNFNVTHPLATKWTLWYTRPPSGKGDNWNDLLKEIITFEGVEAFWGIYNNIPTASALLPKADYHLFKSGIRPEWEDKENRTGGKWAFTCKDRKAYPINEAWCSTLLAAIGEQLEEEEDHEITGVVVNVRRGFYRIGVWTHTTAKTAIKDKEKKIDRSRDECEEVLKRIGRNFKKILNLPEEEQIDFTGHSESAGHGSTRARARFVV